MNEALEAQLSELLSKLIANVEKGTSFAADQIPLVVQEKLTVDFVWSFVFLVLMSLLYAGALALARVCYLKYKNNDPYSYASYHGDWLIGCNVIWVVSTLVWAVVTLATAKSILYIWLAPRIYVLEWLREGLK